jgi:cytochrome c-type biogenesis protein CcmH
MHDELNEVKQQLQQLRSLQADGTLSEANAQAASAPLERRLVELVLAAAPAVVSPAPPPEQARTGRSGRLLWALAVAGIGTLAAAGYWWAGSAASSAPAGAMAGAAAGVGMGTAQAAAVPASAPHAMGQPQMLAMTDRLAARLKTQPDDAEGWGMLARSYTALGRHDEAMAAYQRALKLRPDDALTLADYADALAVRNGRRLDGEPAALIARALKLEPGNLKALLLAGTAAFDKADYVLAAKHWDRAAAAGPSDNPLVQQARNGAAEARTRGGLPAAQ